LKINKKKISGDLQSRLCIYETLDAILYKRQNFDVAFDASLRGFGPMDGRDIGFAREGTMQCLRRLGQIDDILKTLANRPLSEIVPQQLVTLLRVGAVQILFMDVKDHAAVDTVMRLAGEMGYDREKGFLNGVLRNLTRKHEELMTAQKGKEAILNTPEWLFKTWVQDYGEDQALKIAEAHMIPSPVDITVKSDPTGWAEKLGGEVLHNGSVRLQKSGRIPDLEGYADGEWWVQNASAALPVQLMKVEECANIVDLCAAPGGKTLQLAAAGAKVTAVDISKNRLQRLEENLKRCNLSAEVEAADAKVWMPKRPVDAVLIDAPCSATGTIRHQPDVMHLKSQRDIDKLIETQKAILQRSAKFVKKGGELIYCTCSLQKSESEEVVKDFLSKNSNFELSVYTSDELNLPEDVLSPEGFIRLMPFHAEKKGGMDGFFIARIKRI